MICVTLAEASIDNCLKALNDIDFAEIRLDKMKIDSNEVKKIFSIRKKLIATCRSGQKSNQERMELLIAAIEAGASFVDIELESDDWYRKKIIERANHRKCSVIISTHNYKETPPLNELKNILDTCFEAGADIAKIACKVHSQKDNAKLLGLLEDKRSLVVIGIGEQGKITRIIAPFLGSQFSYASFEKGMEVAEGQIDIKTLKKKMDVLKNV